MSQTIEPAPHTSSRSHASAFTLLEVILALAILGGAVAVLGEVMSIASRHATDAQAEAEAQLLAATEMDKLLAGVTPLVPQTEQPIESSSAIPWVCSVNISDTSLIGLTAIEVIIKQDVEKQFRPVTYRLVRWYTPDALEGSDSNTDDTNSDSTGGGDEGADDA